MVNDKQNCGRWETALGFLPQPRPTWRLMLTLHVCKSPQDWFYLGRGLYIHTQIDFQNWKDDRSIYCSKALTNQDKSLSLCVL